MVIKLRETIMILDLHQQGLTVSAISGETDIDGKTVRKYIESGLEAPAFGPSKPRATWHRERERSCCSTASAGLLPAQAEPLISWPITLLPGSQLLPSVSISIVECSTSCRSFSIKCTLLLMCATSTNEEPFTIR